MGKGKALRRGIYHGDREWREETGFTWFPPEAFLSKAWRAPLSTECSEFRLTHKIVERVINPPDFNDPVGFASAVYVADQQCSERTTEEKVIVKAFMRIPYLEVKKGQSYIPKQELLSLKLPIAEAFPDDVPQRYTTEVSTLEYFRQHKFAYAPSFITSFESHDRNPWVVDGFLGFVVMQKLAAVTVSDIWQWEPQSRTQLKEQRRIQEAFKISFTEMRNLGVGHMDSDARNLMWDSKAGKCYFIDFEDTGIDTPGKHKQTWESLSSRWQSPLFVFGKWHIITKDQAQQLHNDVQSTTPPTDHQSQYQSFS